MQQVDHNNRKEKKAPSSTLRFFSFSMEKEQEYRNPQELYVPTCFSHELIQYRLVGTQFVPVNDRQLDSLRTYLQIACNDQIKQISMVYRPSSLTQSGPNVQHPNTETQKATKIQGKILENMHQNCNIVNTKSKLHEHISL